MALAEPREGACSSQTAAYGAVSHARSAREELYGRLGRLAATTAAIVVLGLLFFAAAGASTMHPNSLITKVPKSGPGPRQQRDVNGVLENTVQGDSDLDDEYEQSENKLLGNIEAKLKKHVELDVDSEVRARLAEIKKEEAEKNLESLVHRISIEMSSVASGLKSIEALKAKHRETIKSINKLENEVSSEASRHLFLRAAAWLLPSNETACNSTACGNASQVKTPAVDKEAAEEAEATEPVSEKTASPVGATGLQIKSGRSKVWKKKEDNTIERMMTSIQVARMQKQEEEAALKRMMAIYQHEVKAESKAN